jgi:hypothetical protein
VENYKAHGPCFFRFGKTWWFLPGEIGVVATPGVELFANRRKGCGFLIAFQRDRKRHAVACNPNPSPIPA